MRRRLFPRSGRPPNRTLDVALRRDNYQVLLPPLLEAFVEAIFNCGRAAPDTARERNYTEAERGWEVALHLLRDLAAQNPAAYRPNVADTLNDLGILYIITRRLVDAEKAFSEALTIRRDLAAQNPVAYRPSVARTLTNLGKLYIITDGLADADKAYSEALTIYRDLEANNPVYASNIASLTRALAELRDKSSFSRRPNNPATPPSSWQKF